MRIGLEQLIEERLNELADESRQFNAAKRAAANKGEPTPDLTTSEGLRKVRESRSGSTAPGRATRRLVEVGGQEVPVRVVVPTGKEARGIYLYIAGGGFYMSEAARSDARNASLADKLGLVVVSVDYRLAPECPWPSAPDDCETAALWVLEHGGEEFGTEDVVIGGASAGSNLAMTTLLRLRDRGLARSVAGAVLQFGAYDLSGQSPSGKLFADEWFIKAYAGHTTDRTAPDISPLFGDLRGLPPALVIVGALDILLEDNLAMGARLSAGGVDVDVRVYPESLHGFTSSPTAMAAAAAQDIESWLEDRLVAK